MSLTDDLSRVPGVDPDAYFFELHRRYHDQPRDHVRVHVAWMRSHWSRGHYLRALGHAFAGYVVAAPASLVQRYTGLAVPAFKATNIDTAVATSKNTAQNVSRS